MKKINFKNKKIAILLASLLLVSPCTYLNVQAEVIDDDTDEDVPEVPDSNDNSNLVTIIPTSPGSDNNGGDNSGDNSDNGDNSGSDTKPDDNQTNPNTSDIDNGSDDNNGDNQDSNSQNGNDYNPVVRPTYNNDADNQVVSGGNNGHNGPTQSLESRENKQRKIVLTLLNGSKQEFEILSDIPEDIVPEFYSKIVRNDESSDNYTLLQLDSNLPLPQKLLYLKDEEGKDNLYVVDLDKKIASKYIEPSLYSIGNKKFIISQLLPGFVLPYDYQINKVNTENRDIEIINIKDISNKHTDLNSDSNNDKSKENEANNSINSKNLDKNTNISLEDYIKKFEKDKLSLNYIFAYPIIDINDSSTETSDDLEINDSETSNQPINIEKLNTLDFTNINLGQGRLYNISFEGNKIKVDELESISYPNSFISKEVIDYSFIDSSIDIINSSESNAENGQEQNDSMKLKDALEELAADIELDYLSINNINTANGSLDNSENNTDNLSNDSNATKQDASQVQANSSNEGGNINQSRSEQRVGTNSEPNNESKNNSIADTQNSSLNQNKESQKESEVNNVAKVSDSSQSPNIETSKLSNDSKFNNILYFVDKYITLILLVLIAIIVILISILIYQLIRKKRQANLIAEQEVLDQNYSLRRVDKSNLYNPYIDKNKDVKQKFRDSEYRDSGIRKSNFKDRARIENGMKNKDDFDIEALADVYYNGYDNEDKKNR